MSTCLAEGLLADWDDLGGMASTSQVSPIFIGSSDPLGQLSRMSRGMSNRGAVGRDVSKDSSEKELADGTCRMRQPDWRDVILIAKRPAMGRISKRVNGTG